MGRPKTADYSKQVEGDNGDLIPVADYLDMVRDGSLIDYDGMGDVVKDGRYAAAAYNEATGWPDWIMPSDGDSLIPEDATHILWYNR